MKWELKPSKTPSASIRLVGLLGSVVDISGGAAVPPTQASLCHELCELGGSDIVADQFLPRDEKGQHAMKQIRADVVIARA